MDNQIKQQADELVQRFRPHAMYYDTSWTICDQDSEVEERDCNATHCAIIAVEEIIKSNPSSPSNPDYFEEVHSQARHYWHKVLEELKSRI